MNNNFNAEARNKERDPDYIDELNPQYTRKRLRDEELVSEPSDNEETNTQLKTSDDDEEKDDTEQGIKYYI